MKKKLLLLPVVFVLVAGEMNAQHVKIRLGFPAGVSITAGGRAPFNGAIWIGPEWVWRGGRYECVPGYWSKPHHYGAVWVPGHWKYSRHGYKWVPGHWR
jgi:hypothetical protein